MSNYAERDDTIVFHPGYYINELMDESGLTLEEFAGKIGVEDLLGTSVEYWINLQNAFDT